MGKKRGGREGIALGKRRGGGRGRDCDGQEEGWKREGLQWTKIGGIAMGKRRGGGRGRDKKRGRRGGIAICKKRGGMREEREKGD
jgi:hypothetical protein